MYTVYIYIETHSREYTNIHIYIYTYTHVYAISHMYIYLCTFAFVHAHVFLDVDAHVYVKSQQQPGPTTCVLAEVVIITLQRKPTFTSGRTTSRKVTKMCFRTMLKSVFYRNCHVFALSAHIFGWLKDHGPICTCSCTFAHPHAGHYKDVNGLEKTTCTCAGTWICNDM